jgi:hypothetical protein
VSGVKFETDVLEYPWGYVAVFQDPDGNRLQLRQGHRQRDLTLQLTFLRAARTV